MLALILILLSGQVIAQEDGTLQTVVVMFRHGDRTPIDMYPNDPYKDASNWPVGFGQLTPRGKMMQYNLGKYLRTRYKDFLGEKYSENDIYVRASDVDRTLMSAMSNLAGLYPPKADQIWNQELLWQPIPVHTRPQEEDNIISSHATCPRLSKLVDRVCEDPQIKELISANDWVFKYLTEQTGANITTLWDIDYLFDTLYIESLYNKTLPIWTQKVFPDHMKAMKDLSFKLSTWTHEMKRLRAGPLIQSILDHFKTFINQEHNLKMLMYSGHDTTLSCLLNSLGMFDPPIGPPYASAIIIELRKRDSDNQYFVSFAYRNDTTRDPYDLSVFNCTQNCPLERFEQLTAPIRPENWAEECGISLDTTAQAVTIFSMGVAAVIFLILFVSVIVSCVRSRINKSSQMKDYKYFSIH